ncbi:hypothetical protein V5O48_015717 [Marasmius crinis-equi]|uniref:CxC2-like cysteine cluster KDZ transposase-associated domain-containing protein n=1 Tax=Marasmius crinis-equi TaxID=585013 RepID=A0ABR3ETQ5_9AGAR
MSTGRIISASEYLRTLRNRKHMEEHQARNPRGIWLPPPPLPIEHSFDTFVQGLARPFLVALHTPPTRSSLPLSDDTVRFIAEKCDFLALKVGVPYVQSDGNISESHCMLVKSLMLWSAMWDEHLPEGACRKEIKAVGIWWMERYRDKYLDELIRGEGRGDFAFEECLECLMARDTKGEKGVFRCKDCFQGDLKCQRCCLWRHRGDPLHRIERWSNGSFKKDTLQNIGLVIRLNHTYHPCPSTEKSHRQLQILDINGIHNVTVEFCNCERRIEPYLQLLRRNIYPATQSVIKTCATFRLLEHLHLLSLVGKGSTYDFYRVLEKTSFNEGLDIPPSRYRVLQRMLIQWRHLKMLKRAGRGQFEGGISKTAEGELAIPCPHCPMPKKNLPEGWKEAPAKKQFLYAVMVCIDFNFRLKGQLVSSWTRDPGLGDGLAYFVPRKPYEDYIKKHVSEEDVSTCVGFAALDQQNTRSSKGLRYTGVGATVCARSEMILANGVANLEKGERYSNSDFMVSYALKHFVPYITMLVLAYDIACQWMANMDKRMSEDWNEDLRIPSRVDIVPVIPKFHHPAHRDEEHDQYNCNFVRGLGMSDCECCERLWSVTNGAAASTKPMGPGSRVVVLNDHFGHYNWSKYIGIGATLARRYVQAVKDRNQQVEAHRGLTESLPNDLRIAWEARCQEWESRPWDQKGKSPFRSMQQDLSVHAVEEELKIYEREHLEQRASAYHTTTASSFLVLGIELEAAQRKIKALVKTSSAWNTTAKKSIAEQREVLRKKVKAWALIRPIYMPGLLTFLTAREEDLGDGLNEDVQAEDIPIWMPSRIHPSSRDAACINGLAEMEARLRSAHCHDDLDGIRHTLRLKSRMLLFKHQNVSGQRDGVKSRTVINNVHDRAKNYAQAYRENRKALVELVGEGGIEKGLKPLKDADVRSYTDPERVKDGPGRLGTREDEVDEGEPPRTADEDGDAIDLVPEDRCSKQYRQKHGTRETRMVNSWIWTTGKIDLADGTDEDDELLLEVWARSRARAARCEEEVELLQEEMRRTLRFLTWKGKWWREHAAERHEAQGALREGLRAYALSQEHIQMRLEEHFRKLWSKPLSEMEEEVEAMAAEEERDEWERAKEEGEDAGGDEEEGEEDDEEQGEDAETEDEL